LRERRKERWGIVGDDELSLQTCSELPLPPASQEIKGGQVKETPLAPPSETIPPLLIIIIDY